MINTVKITTGENLKKIRKELGLRQREIVGDDVTRNLISMIENNKTPLSYNIAIIISNNINRISEERNLDIYVDPEDIMSPNRVEAKKKVDKYIEELEEYIKNKEYDLDINYVKKLESFLNEWKIPEKKVVVYEILGDIAHYNGNLKYEYMYLNKALENYFINPIKKDIYILVKKLILNCIKTKRYSEAISLSDLAFTNSTEIPNEHKVSIYYNKALAYKKVGRYDEALEVLKELWEECGTDYKEFIQSLMLQGSCYRGKGEIDKAIESYINIINDFDSNSEQLGLIYTNIIQLFKMKDSKEEVIKYRNELVNILSDIKYDNKHLVTIYHNIAETNEYLDNIELAEYYYINALNEAIDRNDASKIKILLDLLNLYINTDQMAKIVSKYELFKDSFKDAPLSDEMRLALKLIAISIETGRDEEAENIIKHLIL